MLQGSSITCRRCTISGTRVQIDLFFKGKKPQQVDKAFPQLFPAIRAARDKASKLKEGEVHEEWTTKAVYHQCFHDEGKACEAEQEI